MWDQIGTFITAFGEMGLVLLLLFFGVWFFLKRYDAKNTDLVEHITGVAEGLEKERDKWQEIAIEGFKTVSDEQVKTSRIIEQLSDRIAVLQVILRYIRSVQNLARNPGSDNEEEGPEDDISL